MDIFNKAMLLKLSKILKDLSFKFRQRSLYYEFKYYIKSGKSYLKTRTYPDEVIGRTHTLIRLAHKYNCPLIVSTIEVSQNIKQIAIDINKPIEVFGCNEHILSGKIFNLVLLDEGISENDINKILKPISNQIVGYFAEINNLEG